LVKKTRLSVDYREIYGWERTDDEFLIGYGLDWNNLYRNIPFIASVKDQYKK
jgi:hypoxanthine phosphoribosyltransferase